MVEKNVKKAKNKANRVWFDMNLGIIIHKTLKNPTRAMKKRDFKKELDNYWK